LNAAQREAIGVKCKQLIDKGRIQYLTGHGFNARQIYYVQRMLTLENVALVATRCQNTAAASEQTAQRTSASD
jgi:Methyltransferase TRM13